MIFSFLTVRFIGHTVRYNGVTKETGDLKMKLKYAVALLKSGEEKILGIFNTKAEADNFGENNTLPTEAGLQYCFSALFNGDTPKANFKVYDYYNRELVYA